MSSSELRPYFRPPAIVGKRSHRSIHNFQRRNITGLIYNADNAWGWHCHWSVRSFWTSWKWGNVVRGWLTPSTWQGWAELHCEWGWAFWCQANEADARADCQNAMCNKAEDCGKQLISMLFSPVRASNCVLEVRSLSIGTSANCCDSIWLNFTSGTADWTTSPRFCGRAHGKKPSLNPHSRRAELFRAICIWSLVLHQNYCSL